MDGETGEAETLFKGMIDKDKNNLNGYYELYRVYLGMRRIPEAEAILKSAIRNNPKDPQLRLTLAQFYYGTNKRPELVALLNQMKGDLKQFPNAYFQSGDFYLRVNNVDESVKQYEEGIQKDPSRKNTYLKHEIEAYVRSGKTNTAYDKNELILKNDPKDPEARGLRATFMLDKGDVNAAMGELQSVVTAKPNNFVARFNLGRAHFARREYEQARQEFDAAIQLRPDYIPARLAQIQVSLLRGDTDAALHQADETIRIAPNNIEARVMKAAALQRLQRYDEAPGLVDRDHREAAQTGGYAARIGRPRSEPEEAEGCRGYFPAGLTRRIPTTCAGCSENREPTCWIVSPINRSSSLRRRRRRSPRISTSSGKWETRK